MPGIKDKVLEEFPFEAKPMRELYNIFQNNQYIYLDCDNGLKLFYISEIKTTAKEMSYGYFSDGIELPYKCCDILTLVLARHVRNRDIYKYISFEYNYFCEFSKDLTSEQMINEYCISIPTEEELANEEYVGKIPGGKSSENESLRYY